MLASHIEDIKIASHDLGEICKIVSFTFLIPIFVTLYYAKSYDFFFLVERVSVFIIPALILYLLYLIFKRIKVDGHAKTKHVMITVALAWLLIALVGSLPYLLSSTLNPIDSFFESMSGLTTTGMTMIEYPEDLLGDKRDVLFYRSLTQWIGGVGIIMLAMIVFLRKGTAAIEYYSSEVGNLKIRPSIRSTIIETWKIYSLYTLACAILLFLAGMTVFDAINHSLTTLPTGGFSTHSESIGHFHKPVIELVIIIFMLVGGTSFILHFRAFEGKPSQLFQNIEFRYMIMFLVIGFVICSYELYISDPGWGDFQISLFQMVSIMTTTGFGTADISEWTFLSKTVLLVLMLIGGSYGSTGSGVKVLRVVAILKTIFHSIKKAMLPKTAVVRLKLGDKSIHYDEIIYVASFLAAYLIITLIGVLVFNALGYGGYESISVSLSAISNVGPTYLSWDAWFSIPDIGKITLILLMWVGRLEVFPILILFASIVYKKKSRKI